MYMEKHGICQKKDILNGNTKRDASGRALSVRELKKIRERERQIDRWSNSETTVERKRGRW